MAKDPCSPERAIRGVEEAEEGVEMLHPSRPQRELGKVHETVIDTDSTAVQETPQANKPGTAVLA